MAIIVGGEGAPKIIWAGNTLTLPYPQKIDEVFDQESIEQELLNKIIKKHWLGYRYYVELDFEFLNESTDEAKSIIEVLNYLQNADNRTVKFYPHNDDDFYVEVYFDGNFKLEKVSEKQKYVGHALSLKCKSAALLYALPYSWVSPINYSDPDSGWSNEINIYDENTTTYATSNLIQISNYSQFIYLTLPNKILVNKLKYVIAYSSGVDPQDINIDIDGGLQSAYTHLYEGGASVDEVEKSFAANQYDTIRIRFYNGSVDPMQVYLKEVDVGIF